jgi:uncharacterized protein (TIGR02145 family)
MKNHFKFKIVLNILIISLVLFSCEKPKNKENKFPTTPDEIEESVKISQQISKESSVIVESAISKANNQGGIVDPYEIAKSIALIEGVMSATPNPTGSGIIIEHKDSTFSNILIVTKNDSRLFHVAENKSIDGIKMHTKNSLAPLIMPYGKGNALILAPFQDSFKTDLTKITQLLQAAGYTVDQFLNEDATLERFRETFLSNYDLVYISTHGLANLYTWGGTKSTLLLTRTLNDADVLNSVTPSERNYLAAGTINGTDYIAISAPWLYLTARLGFRNSWVFADACESSLVDEGPASLSEAFLHLSAMGYNGYDVSLNATFANQIAITMFDKFSSGVSFTEASDGVRKDPTLNLLTWTIGIGGLDKSFNVNSFDDNQINVVPFYICNPRGEVSDNDGNSYKTVKIINQWWMAENLKTRKYNDGTEIPHVTDNVEWENTVEWWRPRLGTQTGMYCDYDNNPSNSDTYGRLYNWFVGASTNPKNVCPTGWHVPSDIEWHTLILYFDPSATLTNSDFSEAGGNLKEPGTEHWLSPNEGAVYRTGFNALPGGYRGRDGDFELIRSRGFWWSATSHQSNELAAGDREMMYQTRYVYHNYHEKSYGFSIRCLKDN